MADNKKGAKGNGDAADRVAFDYIKSHHFRVIQADGAIGGITPSGNIHFALYSERHAIPKRLVHQLNDDGSLGSPIQSETVARDAIVREMEVDVLLNVAVARNLYQWLGAKIEEWDRKRGETSKGEMQ